MVFDEAVDTAYPARWIGKVTVETIDGRMILAQVDAPKGDPTNTLSRDEITHKARELAHFGGAYDRLGAQALIDRLWLVSEAERVGGLVS